MLESITNCLIVVKFLTFLVLSNSITWFDVCLKFESVLLSANSPFLIED